ncbi:MAG: rhamnan synthesis F family protein [Halioglobus sp.]|nr:rhamnan synthesis F family protein [Halioglobus sp.]
MVSDARLLTGEYSNKSLDPLSLYNPDFAFDPGPNFCNRSYLDRNRDVKTGGFNPLWHFLSSGIDECRWPELQQDILRGTSQTHVDYRIIKYAPIRRDTDCLVYAAYSPDSQLSELQKNALANYQRTGHFVILVLNVGCGIIETPLDDPPCEIFVCRENIGFDFGAWSHVTEIFPSLDTSSSLTFTNDSLLGPLDLYAYSDMISKLRESEADVQFLTNNSEVAIHPQSYYFRLTRSALNKDALEIVSGIGNHKSKLSLIHAVELNLERAFVNEGFSIGVLFENAIDPDRGNPTIHGWSELLARGFPFVKIQGVTTGYISYSDLEKDEHL